MDKISFDHIKKPEKKKTVYRFQDTCKSIAEFDRDFKMTDEYHIIKCTELILNAIEKMMWAVKQRKQGLEIEYNNTKN